MTKAPLAVLLSAFLAVGAAAAPASFTGPAPTLDAAAWGLYRDRFMDPTGRIVDDGNGGISHSEGQGYGLLLAYLANDRPAFDQIWSFTRTEILVRDDGLAAWKWDPNHKPHIVDVNNATDGDILIAYALALAGSAWGRDDFTRSARRIARSIGEVAVRPFEGSAILMPAAMGFDAGERADGPVVNPSYWIFEAFPILASLAPDTDWRALASEGRKLVATGGIGPRKLPPDWLSLDGPPHPAAGFPPEFGYNAIRVPLYLVRAGETDAALLAPFRDSTGALPGIEIVNLSTGTATGVLTDAGYRAIPALIGCVLDGKPFPDDIKTFAPTAYYPSTLHLLALAHASSHNPECL